MTFSDSDLYNDIRVQTGYKQEMVISDSDFDSIFNNARRHIRVKTGLGSDWAEPDWYQSDAREDALFWWACLFTLVAAGELERGDLDVGALKSNTLLAKSNHDVTMWLRNARTALTALSSDEKQFAAGIRSVSRADRDSSTTSTGINQ